MGYEGNWQPDNQTQASDHRRGITHDQVYTEDRRAGRVGNRVTGDCITVNGDIYLGDNPNGQRQANRYDRADERNLDSYQSPGARQYGDNYTGSAARIAELERQNYYMQQQLAQRSHMPYEYGMQQRQYGISPLQMAGAGIGGLIGFEAMQHRGYGGYGGYGGHRHGGGGVLGFLAGSLIGGAMAGGGTYQAEYMPPPPAMAWNNPMPYHYRHESPMQMYQQQRNMAIMRQREQMLAQSGYYNTSNTYDNSDSYSYGYS
jgi:hypothetical protein